MSIVLDFIHITRTWASLRRFAGYAVESAFDTVKQGNIDVAPYFAKILYFLPFASRSLEKVLLYSLVRASYGFLNKIPSYYEVEVNEVQGFNPDETDKVKAAFESMHDLGLAEVISPTKIRLRLEIINEVVKHIAPYVSKNISLQDINTEAYTYPYRAISGASALYIMYKGGRLPASLTLMLGLVSPTAYVKKDNTIERKSTISDDEWIRAKNQMSVLKPLKDKFDVEYFKAIGILYENKIIVRSYPLEVSGNFIDLIITSAYYRYYTLVKERKFRRTIS